MVNTRTLALRITLAALLLTVIALGCQSGTGPLTPAGTAPAGDDLANFAAQFDQLPQAQQAELARVWDTALEASGGTGPASLGEYRLRWNLVTDDWILEQIDSRTGAIVQDVTSVLNNPACPNGRCVNFILNRRDPQTGLTSYTLFLYNPSMTKVWDVRFIWTNLQDADRGEDGELDESNDVIILNARGWTNEFDDFGAIPVMMAGVPDPTAFQQIVDDTNDAWPVINPFHNLASNQSDQSLDGLSAAFTDIEAIVRTNTVDVSFIVTASVGGQRQDPIFYSEVAQVGLVEDNITGRTEIRAIIRDHQGNIGLTTPPDPDPLHLGVEFSSPVFYQNSPDDILQMQLMPANPPLVPEAYYFVEIENWQAERSGKHPFYIRAHSDVNPLTQPINYDLYWKGQVTVVHDPSNGGGGGGGASATAIAYVSTEFGDSDIILDSLTGGGKANLNGIQDPQEMGAEDIDPSFSAPVARPLGGTKRWIAWASNRGTSGNFRVYIWDLNPSGGGLHTFPQPIPVSGALDNCVAPDWSPATDAIVCQCQDNRGRWQIRKYQVVLDASDAIPPIILPPVQLTRANTGDNTSPSYDRSGNFIAFDSTRIRVDNPEIFVMDESGENVMLNRITYQNGADRDPVFASGTGYDLILFQHQGTSWDLQAAQFTSGIYLPPAQASNIQIVTVVGGSPDDVTPNISPDGRTVIFASNRSASGAFDIYTANAAAGGGGDIRRTNNDDDQRRPDWALDTFSGP